MPALVALLACVASSQAPLIFKAEVVATDAVVRLADVADLSILPTPLRERAAAIEVARPGDGQEVLSTRRMAQRARAALPGLTPWLPDAPDRLVRLERPSAETPELFASRQAEADAGATGPLVSPGEALTLEVRVGPVKVEREVRALQAGWPGRRLFVRTPEGEVLTVRLAADR